MSISTTLLIGTIWAVDDVMDVIKDVVNKSKQFKFKKEFPKWEANGVSPNYVYTSIIDIKRGFEIPIGLHYHTRLNGIEGHIVNVQNAHNNEELMSVLCEIGWRMGGFFEREEGKGFISFPDRYSEDNGFMSKKNFLKIKLLSD